MPVPLFDSCAHPTLDGFWLDRKSINASFDHLNQSLKSHHFEGACAIGLAGKNGYSHEAYIAECKRFRSLIPIAGFDPLCDKPDNLRYIKELGYRGIKIHPRFSKLSLEKHQKILQDCLSEAQLMDLVVFWCSYEYCNVEHMPNRPFIYDFSRVVAPFKSLKHVILHAGGVHLMTWVEIARFNPNILLDLSLVLTKYEGSSIDFDLNFVFSKFDRRVCIGSDHPEWGHGKIRERFEYFSKSISFEKKQNIAYKNIKNWLA